jgi:tetratricopeptide (TPR) repeat protein
VQTDPVFAHCDYLQTLAEYGAFGLGLFAVFIAFNLRGAWQRWRRMIDRMARYRFMPADRNALALQLGCMSAVAAYLVHSAVDFNLHIPANALLIAVVFGMLATGSSRPEDRSAAHWSAQIPPLLPAALGLWLLAVSAPKLQAEFLVEEARGQLVSGNAQEGLRSAQEALARGSRTPMAYFYVGEASRILAAGADAPGRRALIQAAHKAYSDGLALFPQDVRLVLMTAWTLQRLDRLDAADVLLDRAAELDPNSGTVWAYHALHRSYARKPDEALQFYQKAANLGCNVPATMAILGERLDPDTLRSAAEALRKNAAASPE